MARRKRGRIRTASNPPECGPVTITSPDGTTTTVPALPQLHAEINAGTIPRDLRSRVLNRDLSTCHDCGRDGADAVIPLVPIAHGGSLRLGNLITVCVPCKAQRSKA